MPLKKELVRENHTPYITKDLRKAISTISRLKTKLIKNPSGINKKLQKRQRNKCVSIRKKSIKLYFSNIKSKGIVTNREFLKAMKPFLTNKGCLDDSDIMLRGDNKVITNDKRLVKLFNEHYINIVERSSELKPEKIVRHNEDFDKRIILNNIIEKYENCSSITKIKNNMSVKSHLSSNSTLATAINNSLASSKFSDIAKVATVIPIDKKMNDKYDISNF